MALAGFKLRPDQHSTDHKPNMLTTTLCYYKIFTKGSARTSSIFFSDKLQNSRNKVCRTNSPGLTLSSSIDPDPEEPEVDESGLDVDLEAIMIQTSVI